MLPHPIGAKHVGREHTAWRNLQKFAHLRMFLSGLNVELNCGYRALQFHTSTPSRVKVGVEQGKCEFLS